jgi:hypothetical protein
LIEKFYQGRSKVENDARQERPVEIATESTTVKYFYAPVFERLLKRWDLCNNNIGKGYVEK